MISSAHWDIIVAAYVVTALALAAMTAWVVLDGRRQQAALRRLEAASPRARARGESPGGGDAR